jgi:2-polyprenyl-3-methyl-5-hydroxy-6-metoxy-1,4-benzoquinol methylase
MHLAKRPTKSFSDEVRSLLRCPSCRRPLTQQGAGYNCSECARSIQSVNGVTRFVDAQNYADSFGFQWKRYARTQLDNNEVRDSEHHFRIKTGFEPHDLDGKLLLDVGCGMGRFADVATRWGARVVGVDLSAAAEVAARNLADRDFLALQADVFHLPFELESFDCIYSLGVLHHTPDCETAVKVLPQYLKPGGAMAIWLYSGYNKWYRFTDIYRKYTHRMSAPALHRLLSVAVPVLYHLDRGLRAVPLAGKPAAGLIHHVFPVNRQADPEARILDTFDWYSPKYQSKHTYEQVFRWFESCGLEDLHVAETPVAVRGRKPSVRVVEPQRKAALSASLFS